MDYLVFDGMNDGLDLELVLVEIKTGTSALSAAEKAIRVAVESGQVRFEVWRLTADGGLRVETKSGR